MIKANFKTYGSYVTDSLYQWDINQTLSVSGLNLSVVPEVHFSNSNMDKAIVRQATIDNHIVSVPIPNSLLQDPITINAYIGVYEGETFKVVEKVEIPVIPRKRPSDYRIEDSDEEVYSFNRLENMIANVVNIEDALNKVTLQKNSACVVFTNAYKGHNSVDYVVSSIVPLINAENYSNITITDVKIFGTADSVGASRFTVSKYGTGFVLFSTDSTAIQTVAGKAVSFEFTLTE